ncbi:UvrD-helicase domain-containing protein [Rhodococcus sp. WAY2]|uniref:UvrD-helicase domain-containing protein n=1 Tax=Rhodococcus sp. WAY2 TaxID=2663121 RepID=UPI00131FB784|nr:UvrD-helicase domain-containing protein [Rhodococcus sp. WAY2]QHE73622.1 putative DNA helicase [Rhodococcus sp. WAY2]
MSPLPQPKGKQPKVIHLSSDQHHVVLGTAGTGKSTMAMMRALHLARPSTANNGPVLVVTFNNALVTYLKYLEPAAQSKITIETYAKFARGYLNSKGHMEWGRIAKPEQVSDAVAKAVQSARRRYRGSVLDRDLDWFIDELHWISGMGFTTEDAYQLADRVGRHTPLQKGLPRKVIWEIRDAYRKFRDEAGFWYDWYDLAAVTRGVFERDSGDRKYLHIIIDEGQDLSPEAIRSLTLAVAPGGSLTFFGDYHQAIYGQGLSWRSAGINLNGRPTEKFVDNLRNTAEIARVAIALAQSTYMKSGDIDLVEPVQPIVGGVKPTLARCVDGDGQIDLVRRFASDRSKVEKVAILARTWESARRVAGPLPYRRLDADLAKWDDEPGLYVGAYHSAKGLEFASVCMPFLDESHVPHPEVLAAYVEDEACAREARLLYVSITRARSTLLMTYSGTLTRLLPDNTDLWDEMVWP